MGAPYTPPLGAAALSPLALRLALSPAERARLMDVGMLSIRPGALGKPPYKNCACGRPANPVLQATALEYCRIEMPAYGTLKRLAQRDGINLSSLKNAISVIRAKQQAEKKLVA